MKEFTERDIKEVKRFDIIFGFILSIPVIFFIAAMIYGFLNGMNPIEVMARFLIGK